MRRLMIVSAVAALLSVPLASARADEGTVVSEVNPPVVSTFSTDAIPGSATAVVTPVWWGGPRPYVARYGGYYPRYYGPRVYGPRYYGSYYGSYPSYAYPSYAYPSYAYPGPAYYGPYAYRRPFGIGVWW